MARSIGYLGVFFLWNLVAGFFLLFVDPVAALPVSLVLYAGLLYGYLLRPHRGETREQRWEQLQLYRLSGPELRWTFAAIPVVLVLSWAIGDVYTRLVPVPAESLNPFEDLLASSDGRLLVSVFAIGIAPIVEEFIFRGLIQNELAGRYGALRGIGAAAALFALVHLLPWVFPLHFFLGVAFGFAVWATRSIWAGVLLHTANNTAAMFGFAASGEEPTPTGTLWEFGLTTDFWVSVFVLILSSTAAAWMVRRALRVRRDNALPSDSRAIYLR